MTCGWHVLTRAAHGAYFSELQLLSGAMGLWDLLLIT